MTRSKAMSLAAKWAEGGVCTLREDEAREYHKICLEALRAQQQNLSKVSQGFSQGQDNATLTRADRIRAMSDEELAKAIAGADWCEYCDQVQENGTCHAMELGGPLNQHCIAGCLKWLQKPVEEADHGYES